MIDQLDETIEALLKAEIPIRNNEFQISFEQPKREVSARWGKPTINLHLYDLRENNVLRQHQWERLPGGNGGVNQARLKRTPMRVDCHYMITTWVSDHPLDEHLLMSRCILALFRYPILPEKYMPEGSPLREQTFEIPARLASHDRLTNPAEVWSALDNEIRPSVSYVVTLAFDPWTEVSGPMVRGLFLRSGQADQLPGRRELAERTVSELVDIGGTVREGGKNGSPLVDVNVAVKGTGLYSTTDPQGHFVLGSLPAGEYTLVAWPESGKPVEKKVSLLPGAEPEACDYDIVL
jgi:hypothetical protein